MSTPGFLVWRLSTKWRAAVDRALAPLGLTHAHYTLLGSLYGMRRAGQRPSQRQLADHIGLEPLYVSKIARSLEAAGIIERSTDPNDVRAVQLSLTEHGAELTGQAVAIVAKLVDQLMAPLGGLKSERTQVFARELNTLLNNLESS